MLQCIGTHAKKRQLALDPLAHLVGTHIRHCRLLLTNHDSPNLGHVDRQPTVHATVNLRVGPVQHPAQPIVQRVRVRTVSDTVQRPLTQSQPDTRRDIIRLPLISETNLHHARLLPRGLLLTVKDTSRSTHNSFFFLYLQKKSPPHIPVCERAPLLTHAVQYAAPRKFTSQSSSPQTSVTRAFQPQKCFTPFLAG